MAVTQKAVEIVLDRNDEGCIIDFGVINPDYRILSDALKEGRSWYDIIYPRNDRLVGTVLSHTRRNSVMKYD